MLSRLLQQDAATSCVGCWRLEASSLIDTRFNSSVPYVGEIKKILLSVDFPNPFLSTAAFRDFEIARTRYMHY